MRPLRLKYRHKLLIPSAVALAASLLAVGVTLAISGRAAAELTRAQMEFVPGVLVAQELEVSLGRLQRQLQDAASGQDLGELETADEIYREMAERVAAAPRTVVAASDRTRIASELDSYHRIARAVTARLIQREQGQALDASLRDMASWYRDLRGDLAEQTVQARRAMAESFEKARRDQRRAVVAGAVIVALAALLSGALAWWLARGLSRPLESLRDGARRVAEGDLTQAIEPGSQDEVGDLADSFAAMVTRLRAIVTTLRDSSGDLAGASRTLTQLARGQTALAEAQASGVAETTTTTRELEQTSSLAASRATAVLDVARKAAEFSEAGQTSAEASLRGIQQIQESVEKVVGQSTRLFEQARLVSEIVETVKDLATQSHVLSLNASIEAARAGEAGRGFGVVASEVRGLAEQSGQSAARIGKIVQDIVTAIQSTLEMTERSRREMEGSVGQIRSSGEALGRIGAIVRETSDAALQIATAVQQQSTGIAQIATAMRDLNTGMEETVTRIQSLEEATGHLDATAMRISQIVSGFRV